MWKKHGTTLRQKYKFYQESVRGKKWRPTWINKHIKEAIKNKQSIYKQWEWVLSAMVKECRNKVRFGKGLVECDLMKNTETKS